MLLHDYEPGGCNRATEGHAGDADQAASQRARQVSPLTFTKLVGNTGMFPNARVCPLPDVRAAVLAAG